MTNLSRRFADTTEGRVVPTPPVSDMASARTHARELVSKMLQKQSWTGLVICEWDFQWPMIADVPIRRDPLANIGSIDLGDFAKDHYILSVEEIARFVEHGRDRQKLKSAFELGFRGRAPYVS